MVKVYCKDCTHHAEVDLDYGARWWSGCIFLNKRDLYLREYREHKCKHYEQTIASKIRDWWGRRRKKKKNKDGYWN